MKVFFTSALIDSYYEQRKKEYIDSFNFISNYVDKKDIHIIECYKSSGPTYLDDISENVFYTGTDSNLSNKGVKEALGLIKFLEHNNFNDLILKLTGRYIFTSPFFISDIMYNENNYDSFIRKDIHGQVFCGAFGIRCELLKDFLHHLDLPFMESRMVNIERELANYIDRNNINYKQYEKIELKSNINNNDLVYW